MSYARYFFFILSLLAAAISAAADEQLLDPEQAYRLEVRAIDKTVLEARWRIAEGYYLYRSKIGFAIKPGALKTGEPVFPPGKIKDDEFFGKVETYRNEVAIRIPLPAAMPEKFALAVVSQGCSDLGVCFPPQTQQVDVDLTAAPAAQPGAVSPVVTAKADDATGTDTGNSATQIESLLSGGSMLLILTSFFGFGIALSLTPCVFPMIPILSGIIVNHGERVTRARAAVLSAAYVLGMAVTYAAAGVVAGLSGTLVSGALQNPWVLGSFAAVFVALSLSMFGFYELQLPKGLQSRLSSSTNARKGSIGGIALMGALSALIVGPCVAAPLAGALLYIANTSDAVLGGIALFTMALGMGTPLMLVGIFSRSLLPKAGAWMTVVTRGFGVALLATALWIVSPVLPGWAVMLGVALLLIIPAIYLHALDPLPVPASGWKRLWKGVGVSMLVAGCGIMIGLLSGARDPLQPLSGFHSAAAATNEPTRFEHIATEQELDARLKTVKAPVLLDFYADWCVSCKEMEKITFAAPDVRARLTGMTLLQVDVTANNDAHKALLKRFHLFGPPAIVMFDAHGKELTEKQVVGFMPPDKFIGALESL
ncbi:MAG: thiol:disulfide interchange protein [Betaproteobacteria bacterium RBG_16_56_24]|nr:MAG: thiol:disulfide interchange protein [Betaproteobacteria bacterium RBG_16_56_24]